MKKYLLVLSILLMSFTQPPTDRLNVKGPLTFDKTKYNLAWTDKPNKTYYIQEYLPTGESVEHFNKMLTLHFFDSDIEVSEALKQKITELEARKKTDATCHYQVSKSPDGKEFIVDFLLGESKDGLMSIIEFNIYRYMQISFDNNKKGILVYAYSERAYDDDITPFLKNLKSKRSALLNLVAGGKVPTVNPANN